MTIRDSLLDAVGFGGAGQLAHQLEGKRDRAAEAVAGGDAAVYNDFLIVDDGTGQLVLKSGVGGGVPAFQQAEAGEELGAAQMAATFLPALAKETQVSVTVLFSARLGVPGIPPGRMTMSTSL